MNLLASLGQEQKLNDADFDNIRELIRSIIYARKDDEDYVGTRIRLYKSLKNKSSMPLSPDLDSVIQVIKRAHYQAYEWYHCGQQKTNHLDLEDCGWTIYKRDMTPIWFLGNQFPPTTHTTYREGRKATDGNVADDEINNSDQRPPAKKARTLAQGWRRRKRLTFDDKSLEDQPTSNPQKTFE